MKYNENSRPSGHEKPGLSAVFLCTQMSKEDISLLLMTFGAVEQDKPVRL
jgi:hypothetical protein